MTKATWVSAGLFLAWAVHDAEELVTAAASSRELVRRAPTWLPLPADLRRDGFSQHHMNVAIAVVAGFMGIAALDGARSGGRSWFFQTVLRGFGWHGIGHLAAAALSGKYVTGAATTPLVVIPYWLWARHELARDGVPLRPVDSGPLLIVPVLIAAHAITRAITGRTP